jgi:hypothetical protein
MVRGGQSALRSVARGTPSAYPTAIVAIVVGRSAVQVAP